MQLQQLQFQQSQIQKLNHPLEMRNSNSRGNSINNSLDKPASSTYSQNRLMKTQLPPKTNTKQALNSTEYKLPPNTPSIKKIESSKTTNQSNNNLPKQQINYDIKNNMTQSKVITAKESLLLLKKKMNKTGMSREKPTNTPQSSQNIQSVQKNYPQSMQKIKSDSAKNIDNYEPTTTKYSQSSNKNYEQQQTYNSRDTYEPQSYKPPAKKPMQQQKPPIKKTTSFAQNTYNEAQQIPIVRKQTFEEILERQLRKEQQMKSGSNNNNAKKQQNSEPEQYAQNVELFQCSKGCGRQFNENVLSKHEKVCQKVFQSKRKVFNTAAQRQLEQGGFQKNQQTFNQTKKPVVEKKNKIPKWKLQSAQLRVGLKATGNVPLTAEQEALSNMQKDTLVQCSFCGRKFNEEAAKRHIPHCQKKNKQMSRPSNSKKR